MLINSRQILKFLKTWRVFIAVIASILGLSGLLSLNMGCMPPSLADAIVMYYIILPAIVAVPIGGAHLILRYTKRAAAKNHRRFIWIGITVWLTIIWFVIINNHVNPPRGMLSNTEMNTPQKQ